MSGTLIDTSAYIPNSVNAVLQTDPVQGKAAGAPFGGIGASNAAAQVLANRTAFLYGRQNTNISNIRQTLNPSRLSSGLSGCTAYSRTVQAARIGRG